MYLKEEREVTEQCVFETGVLFSASACGQIHPKLLYLVEYILNCHEWLCFRVVPAHSCSAYKVVVRLGIVVVGLIPDCLLCSLLGTFKSSHEAKGYASMNKITELN